MNNIIDMLPTIPQYYKLYVDNSVDLDNTPSQPCPFHNEVNGKSFTYSRQLNVWRCWGACHCGGDVIDLHRLNYKLKTRKEAEKSLCQLCNIDIKSDLSFEKKEVTIDEKDVHRRRVYALALKAAKSVDDWLELDYIVSKVPFDVKELEVFCNSRGFPITSNITMPE